ncbi:MAG TPA: MgtC/SapB family protein [Vicinamibacterales bacterium]|nr:MgtC/SapB family protein [Vicinamibacterales bacterium]
MADSLFVLLVAVLGGAAVGVERQWSGHASGPAARFAGVRTFALLGALGGVAGRLWIWDAAPLAVVILSVSGLLIVVGYVAASPRDVDATTETAALVVLGAGACAGLGETGVASGIVAVTALLLLEKSRLHDLVARLQGPELGAAFRFGVMAVVVLPLLPTGPLGTWGGGFRPRELWLLVLLFSGLSFIGYIAERIIGASRGYVIAGLLGGMVSSTTVTLGYARRSRDEASMAQPLAQGVIAANTVLYGRVVLAAGILSPALALALAPALAVPALVGLIAVVSGLRAPPQGDAAPGPVTRNPLQLRSALEMAVLFQVVLIVVALVGDRFGASGLLGTAAVLGLNDADALTLSMARQVGGGMVSPTLGAQAVAVGLLSNTIVKAGLALTAGRGAFRAITVAVLLLMAVALGAAIVLLANGG